MTAVVAEADEERKAQALVRDDAPKLLATFKEMKDGLNLVRTKVELLTRKEEPAAELLPGSCLLPATQGQGAVRRQPPVVRSLVEIRLFLEKIRPIDKKMEYQIQKLTNAADGAAAQDKVPEAEGKDGIYVPPRIGPAAMDDNHSKDAIRKEERLLRMATENPYLRR
uniref:Uncharacterized protein n=1 Tax=Triticum aestivum TaxID=4565 RepID=A0A077S730_WHEAT|nr:unnamed protein product [Triticum aestivum]